MGSAKDSRRWNSIGAHLVALVAIQLVLVWGLVARAPLLRGEPLVFAVAAFGVPIAMAFLIRRRLVRPITRLIGITERFREGDMRTSVEASGPTELAALGESVDHMMHVRAGAEKALQKAVAVERRANLELREIDRMRSAFLMAISHELRTPLTSVVGYATLLDESLESLPREDIAISVKAIAAQSRRLERLLFDLLDTERLSRGRIEPELADTGIRDLVMRVVETTSANGRMHVAVGPGVRAYVDTALTERIVENLVVNAIKHTPSDSRIWVKAVRRNRHVRIVVEDSGPGVPDALKEAIFEPFKQGDAPENSPGTGIGLSLVAQFAKLHGGRAWVEDRRGGGASFRVELPATPGTKPRRRVA